MASSSFSVRFNINNSKSRPSSYKVPSNTRPSSYKSTTSAGSRPSSYKFNNESKENEQEKCQGGISQFQKKNRLSHIYALILHC